MPEVFPIGLRMLPFPFIVASLLSAAVASGDFLPGMSLTLQRGLPFPSSHGLDISYLRDRDRIRHRRMLRSLDGVVTFPVDGSSDPFLVGLYYASVQLGSPSKEFYVQIDTGSDALWVSCSSCSGCPTWSGLHIELELFDPSSSSTASLVSCSDKSCSLGGHSCSNQTGRCTYNFQFGDGSETSGYFVSDLMHFDTIVDNSLTSSSSAKVLFGCSTLQTGDLTKTERAVDGIFGFGQHRLSIISQLSSMGLTPNVFSHCLKGDSDGGGILVLGRVVEPNLVFTPLIPSQTHYNLNLQSIAVDGKNLTIDPSVFSTKGDRGTIVDSGTTLAYLSEEAYDHFDNAIREAVTENAHPLPPEGSLCYRVTGSISGIFPTISLNFAGGASMILQPEAYLLQQNSINGAAVWCLGIQKIQGNNITILGDLILKDKIVVYDLTNQQIGWADYDCSSMVNVSATTGGGKGGFVSAGELRKSSSSRNAAVVERLQRSVLAFLLHPLFFAEYLFWGHLLTFLTGKTLNLIDVTHSN